MLKDTVFAKASNKDIRLEPFPRLVVEEALDRAHYERLLSTRPPYPGVLRQAIVGCRSRPGF